MLKKMPLVLEVCARWDKTVNAALHLAESNKHLKKVVDVLGTEGIHAATAVPYTAPCNASGRLAADISCSGHMFGCSWDPPIFTRVDDVDDNWLTTYERLSAHSNRDEEAKLGHVLF